MRNFILADNQELTRLGLKTLLSEFEGRKTFVVTDKAALLERLRQDNDAVVVIDFTLFDFVNEDQFLIVTERFPKASWVLISEDLNHEAIKKFVYSSKRISVMFKDTPLDVIREGIRVTLSGSRFICQHATEVLLAGKIDEQTDSPACLTSTELAVLKAIVQGRTTKEIAAERNCSIHTINSHRKNIFRKLGVNTAHEAIKRAFMAGLVNPSEFYI